MSVILLNSCKATPPEYDNTIYNLKIEIQDISAPEIIITSPLEFEENEKQSIKEFIQIKDNKDEQLSFELEGNIDFTKAGDYLLTIKTKDSDNNEVQKEIVVKVHEKKKEEVSPTYSEPILVPRQNIVTSPPGTTPQNSSTSSPAVTVRKGVPKKFLFTDGYNMSTVSKACSDYLNQFDVGSCYPLQDSTGKYLGMEYQP